MRTVLEEYSDNPSAFLALNSGNSHFTVPGLDGVITYREAGRRLVQFGGPVGDPALLAHFTAFARATRRRVVAIQVQADDVPVYEAAGYTVNQVGASYAVDLARFTLRGKKFVRLRNKIARATRSGLIVKEVGQPDWHDRMKALDARWLAAKGKHTKELEFLVGEYGGAHQQHRRLFVGTIEGELAGYVSYSPAYGSRPGWLHDLSRRRPDGPPGVMEAINSTAIDAFRSEGAAWLHFGFTPFTGLAADFDTRTRSGWFAWLVRQLAARGAAVYPAATQLAYKEKWGPHAVIPEYIAFQGRASVYGFLQVFKAANAL
ncbi:bifunctional lysylphosphatidylglycerol flippase/synthetase MprF [Actinophytocola sp.]|uniref:bifunctional lysylphosphatidylglycerol flippase/synthetase MprF n=1 Tax=Actinophytocola sp. TaxID=1872138 RepID=UPI00389A60C2